jgi:hypothetical protein
MSRPRHNEHEPPEEGKVTTKKDPPPAMIVRQRQSTSLFFVASRLHPNQLSQRLCPARRRRLRRGRGGKRTRSNGFSGRDKSSPRHLLVRLQLLRSASQSHVLIDSVHCSKVSEVPVKCRFILHGASRDRRHYHVAAVARIAGKQQSARPRRLPLQQEVLPTHRSRDAAQKGRRSGP